MAAPPLAPAPNYSTPKHFLTQKSPKINLKLAENLDPQRISSSPTSISWSKAGQRSRKSSRITGHDYVSGAFDAVVSENEPRIEESEVEFFDRYKVGELTALLTSDLGSLNDIVSENISRDRGFRHFPRQAALRLYPSRT